MTHFNSKATPINYTVYAYVYKLYAYYDYSCHININHMGFISCHTTPLVIYSLGGGHTHSHARAQTWTRIPMIHTESILRNQAHLLKATVPGLKTLLLKIFCEFWFFKYWFTWNLISYKIFLIYSVLIL